MAVLQPPITGDNVLDAWTYQITKQLELGGGIGGATTESAAGEPGSFVLVLYTRTEVDTPVPTVPSSVTYDISDPANVSITADNSWTYTRPTIASGRFLWATFRYVSGLSGLITDSATWNTPTIIQDDGLPALSGSFLIVTRSATTPATPADTTDYSRADATYTVPVGWYSSVPAGSDPVYTSVGQLTVAEDADTGTIVWGDPVRVEGADGAQGDPAPRYDTRNLYIQSATQPTAPQATLTWSTGALSAIETGWSDSAPTQTPSTDPVWRSQLLFIDTTGVAATTTATGNTAVKAINFDDVVTFSAGDFSTNGSTITTIDGGNITTGTINASKIAVGGTPGAARMEFYDDRIEVYDASNVLRVRIGNLNP